MALKFRVELVWQGETPAPPGSNGAPSSIYLTSDGRVVLQGRKVTDAERTSLDLPQDGELISVDRALITAIKEML